MADTRIRLRLIVAAFVLACLSLVAGTALLVGHFLTQGERRAAPAGDILGDIEAELARGEGGRAWADFARLAQGRSGESGLRGAGLLWRLWRLEARPAELRAVAGRLHALARGDDERAAYAYLLLEAGQGSAAGRLDPPGQWSAARPELEAELALARGRSEPVRFGDIDDGRFADDTRVDLDRAFAWGYLGDWANARLAAQRVVDLSSPPGANGGTGLIDPARGLCRRQAARMVQVMAAWDAADPNQESLMHQALAELMADPDGLAKVAPDYFDTLCDAAAWTGDRARLERLYRVADAAGHALADEQRENRSLLAKDPGLRPETHAELRRLLAQKPGGDPRALVPLVADAAARLDDGRSWRLYAWYLQRTGDRDGLDRLLERRLIDRGPWRFLADAWRLEASGDLDGALDDYRRARQGALAHVSLLNQARLELRAGRVERAASLAAEARQGIELRSIGLFNEPDSAYAGLYADALALQARILRVQGREAEGQALLRRLAALKPDHPELYGAKGLSVEPETETEKN